MHSNNAKNSQGSGTLHLPVWKKKKKILFATEKYPVFFLMQLMFTLSKPLCIRMESDIKWLTSTLWIATVQIWFVFPCHSFMFWNIWIGVYGNDVELAGIHQKQQPQHEGVCSPDEVSFTTWQCVAVVLDYFWGNVRNVGGWYAWFYSVLSSPLVSKHVSVLLLFSAYKTFCNNTTSNDYFLRWGEKGRHHAKSDQRSQTETDLQKWDLSRISNHFIGYLAVPTT